MQKTDTSAQGLPALRILQGQTGCCDRDKGRKKEVKKLKIGIIACLFLFELTALSWAGEFTAFGPKNFKRGTGSPVTIADNITIRNPDTEFFLRVYNGGLENSESELVSSSIILLNGSKVLGPENFNQTVRLIEKPVVLESNNIIQTEVRGKPGGSFTVLIVGKDSVIPQINNLNPANNAEIEDRKPRISASYTDLLSGIDTSSVHI